MNETTTSPSNLFSFNNTAVGIETKIVIILSSMSKRRIDKENARIRNSRGCVIKTLKLISQIRKLRLFKEQFFVIH